MRNILTAAILGLAAVALTACSLVATFPSDTRVLDRDSVASEPIPTLIVEAVNYACAMYDPDGDPAINLPAGTGMALYAKVIDRLGDGHPQLDPDEPAFSIVKVRARGSDGEVVEGDPNHGTMITDIWTLASNPRSRDPDWTLVATRSPN